jgi:hypothetical protein
VPDELKAPAPGERPRFADLASDAIRYWERRRPLYNLVLLGVVLAHFAASWPDSKELLGRDPVLFLFGLAVLANVVFCAAYAVDIFVQLSGTRAAWVQWQWALLAIGTAFAAVVAHFVMLGMLGGRIG